MDLPFSSEREEVFYDLPLDIKGSGTLQKSLDRWVVVKVWEIFIHHISWRYLCFDSKPCFVLTASLVWCGGQDEARHGESTVRVGVSAPRTARSTKKCLHLQPSNTSLAAGNSSRENNRKK